METGPNNLWDSKEKTYLDISCTPDNIAEILRDLNLIEKNGCVTLREVMEDSDVYLLEEIYDMRGFNRVTELRVNPSELSLEARTYLYNLTRSAKFPELHCTEDDWTEISIAVVDHLKQSGSHKYDDFNNFDEENPDSEYYE